MTFPKRAAALAAGVVAALALTGLGASRAMPNEADTDVLVVDDAMLDWVQVSNVAALREGVIDRMELTVGMSVAKGAPIGYLHAETARLTFQKAEVAYKGAAPKAKVAAMRQLARAVVARNERLIARIPGVISGEDAQKAEAELKLAEALNLEAEEKRRLDKAELDLAEQALKEHTIVAPFDGIVIERMKNPGEGVRDNEAVVKLANLARLRAYFWVPLQFAFLVKVGQEVDFQQRLTGNPTPRPTGRKRFRGKVTFVDPQVQPIAETAVRVYAEFDNKGSDLRPGLKGVLTVYLNSDAGAPGPVDGVRTTSR
jgi:RND family efflux transporter MFP subunit